MSEPSPAEVREPVVFPAIVLIDGNEQRPYGFRGLIDDPLFMPDGYPDDMGPYTFEEITADAKQEHRPVVVRTMTANLLWGDYSLDGFQSRLAVERKSVADLFGTLGHGRKRFEAEVDALNEKYECARIVIEGCWCEMLTKPPANSQMIPKTIHRTMLSWTMKYPRVHWIPCCCRELAEVTTFRILEMFHRKTIEAEKPKRKKG